MADPLTPRVDGALYEISGGGDLRRAGRLTCKQSHVSRSGAGLCLRLSADDYTYEGVVFDARYRPLRRFPVLGVPDRARVSPDGRYGAYTAFNRGSSRGYFASSTEFSTNTQIVDLRTGKATLALTDRLEIRRAGRRFRPDDSQFWGVTFGSGGRFYATLATGRSHYLVAGRVGSRRLRLVGDHVECPSLSPDGRRIAYKRRIGHTNTWRLHVLDIDTRNDVALAETRSIDDQPEWLGNDRVMYSDDRSVFVVAADGTGGVARLAGRATSPASLTLR